LENNGRVNVKPGLIASGIAIFLMLLFSAWAWTSIPGEQKIPVHWNIHGQPDRYGGKFEGLLLTPLIAVALSLLFLALPFIEPRKLNLEKSKGAYFAIWMTMLLFTMGVHVALVFTALGWKVNVSSVVFFGIGGLFMVLGVFLGKMRSNFFMGVRTPWTLSSELSWKKTHELAGRIFLVLGVFVAISAFFTGTVILPILLFAGIIGSTIFLCVYSYVVWKKDPDKSPGQSDHKIPQV